MFLILIIAWVAGLQPAHAQSGLLVISGSAAEHERTTVSGAIENVVRSAGWSLPAKALGKKDTDRLLNCSDAKTPWTCIPPSVSAAGIRDVLVVSVESSQAENGARMLVITGTLIVTSPQSFAVRRRFCEHCADDKLAKASEDLTQQLIQELAARGGRTVVSIKSQPTSADITLDNAHVGATDATFNTFPGNHTAIVQKPGFISEVKEFTAIEGKTTELSFVLRPSTPSAEAHPVSTKTWSSRWSPRIAISAGAALLLFGGVSIYRGQRYGGTDGRYEYRHATTVGVVTGLVGLGALGTGLYLHWAASDSSTPKPGTTSSLAVVGWSGRF